jgi:hypothetical protein
VITLISITILDVHPDPYGSNRERNKKAKLNQEWIDIKNIGDEDFKLNGRVLMDRTPTNQHRHKKVISPMNPNFASPVGLKIRIYTGKMDDPTDIPPPIPEGIWKYFLDHEAYIWNALGDMAEVHASEAHLNKGRTTLARKGF